MSLRELKKETHALPQLKEHTEKLTDSCIHPLKALLHELPHQHHAELGDKFKCLKNAAEQLIIFQNIQDKLQHQSRQLIELKLSEFTQDTAKAKVISHRLLKDDFFNIPQTLLEIRMFGAQLKDLQETYKELHQALHKNLSLEHHVQLLHLPYRQQFASLMNLFQQQQNIAKSIGKEFIKMAKNNRR
ncbi:hypothetical protein HYX13_00515 [Candidatus Woesearchaeota archaeon]|nr:hypothetical protein [Candidatus Woesearchaeota archaeon]